MIGGERVVECNMRPVEELPGVFACEACGRRVNVNRVSRRALQAACAGKPPGPAPVPMSQTAVVIVSHNYGRFLRGAIASVLAQTRRPAEVLVVDDSSEDETAAVAASFADAGVRYHRTENRHVHKNRLEGAALTSAPFLIFLDADDELPPGYIAAAEDVAAADSGCGLVFTDFELFGVREGLHRLEPVNIERRNYLHCASLVRRAALESVAWPDVTTAGYTHNDWFAWRRILRLGWRAAKSPVPLRYRQHEQSMMHVAAGKLGYFDYAAVNEETIQVVLPLSGRVAWFPRLQAWFERQEWPRVSLLVGDASGRRTFGRMVRAWLATLDVETAYVPLPSFGDLADRGRIGQADTIRAVQVAMPQLYNPLVRRLTEELVLWVEDDVLPPVDAIPRLARGLDAHVAAVSGVVSSRFGANFIAWRSPNREPIRAMGAGLETVHGSGFGCLLVRRSVLQAHPLRADGVSRNYDQEFAFDVAADGMGWRLDWSVGCHHQDLEPYELRTAT